MLEHWHHTYGMELVRFSGRGMEFAVARPPRTRAAALALAWEYASYCPDGAEGPYRSETLPELAAGLLDADILRTWWD